MTQANETLDQVLHAYLDRRGGVVIERLIGVLKRSYSPDAPELQSEAAFKAYLATKPDVFRVAVSANNVERARLANPRRASQGLIGNAIATLEELKAFDEASACQLTVLYQKAVEAKQEQSKDGDALPYDLANPEEFVRSVQRFKRIHVQDGKVWITPRAARRPPPARGADGEALSKPQAGQTQDGQALAQNPERVRGAFRERRPRPQGTPKEPMDLGDQENANDATLIAGYIYRLLCERGAVEMNFGLTVKLLLRLVSVHFKSIRPESNPSSMNSLRAFKSLVAHIPGIRRQRPRTSVSGRPGRSRGLRYAPEMIIWMEDEAALVKGIKDGLPEDAANVTMPPDVLENVESLQAGTAVDVQITNEQPWNTKVVGPTSSEAVLAQFLKDHEDQAIWGFETEHRVGLHGKPAGKIAVIILSDMQNTIIWDVHVGGVPQCLRNFLTNDHYFKGAIRVRPRAQKLFKQFNITPVKFVELSEIARFLNLINEEEHERCSMRTMTNKVVNYPISRPPGVRDSNWELRPLTKRQYTFAVEDGFITALLFMHMVAMLHKINEGAKLNDACVSIDVPDQPTQDAAA